jgi:hypothetical protein
MAWRRLSSRCETTTAASTRAPPISL